MAVPQKRFSTATVESTKTQRPDVVPGQQKPCCSTSVNRNEYRSPDTAETGCSSAPDPKTCCSSARDAKSPCHDNPTPTLSMGCASTPSIRASQVHGVQYSHLSKDGNLLDGHQSIPTPAMDLEKGSATEHAVTQISGMTCSGCERKLERVLSSIAGVQNVKTSLVLGRAEFDVGAGFSVKEIASLLERQTEFKCTAYQEGHQLEVLVPSLPSTQEPRLGPTASSEKDTALLHRNLTAPNYPPGVQDVQFVDINGREWKSTIARTSNWRHSLRTFAAKPEKYSARITYDPRIVGARDLMEKSFGVPLSLTPLSSDHASATDVSHLRETLYMTLISACLTIPVLVMSWAPLPPHTVAYGSASLALATLVQFIVAGPFYPKALKALVFSRMIEMDLLIVISTTTAYVYSVVAFVCETKGKPLSTGGFFQTSTLLVTLIMFGRLASAYARRKAAESISIQALQSSTAVLLEGTKERIIDVREFQYGDLFKVLPDCIVPTDGIIMSGETEIDESMITGEANPVPKFSDSKIIAGSVNGPGPIVAQLSKLPIDNTLGRIASMVDEAKLSKPKVQDTADRVASYFVPFILALTVVVFSIWIAVGIAVRKKSHVDAIVTAITYALAALVVSCPCAIGLAVPMVMVIAGGVGAKHGVIFKSPGAIENARKATHVVFDKTGTLTQGKFVVVEEVYREGGHTKAIFIARQLASSSKHPVSQALTTHLGLSENSPFKIEGITSVIGKGMCATLDGQLIKGGNPLYIEAAADPDVQRLLSQGLTVFCLRLGPALLAIYGLRDALRPDTPSVISKLQAQGILVSVLSGDSSTAVETLANDLGIPLARAKGHCSPEAKARYLASLSRGVPGRKSKGAATTTLFCGDGSNDAVALAQADVGVHMAVGTDVAKSAADVVLTHPSLTGILVLLDLSAASMRRVYVNFVWSFVYNLFAILLAAGAFVKARVPPAYAGLGELVSVLPVVGVAMQLRWIKFR